MDRRDRELLDKQLRHLQTTPRNDGVMMLALLTVFFTGMAVGGFSYAYTGAPVQIAVTQAAPSTSACIERSADFRAAGNRTRQ